MVSAGQPTLQLQHMCGTSGLEGLGGARVSRVQPLECRRRAVQLALVGVQRHGQPPVAAAHLGQAGPDLHLRGRARGTSV